MPAEPFAASGPSATPATARVTVDEVTAFLAHEFPQMPCTVLQLGAGRSRLLREVTPADLRPGGTVSGPTMMALADVSLYVALFTCIGITPMAVTSNMTTHFLRRPAAGHDLLAECRMLKVGRTLAVGEVSIYSEGQPDELVAHVVGTYAIPLP